jgi:hypothetical protein
MPGISGSGSGDGPDPDDAAHDDQADLFDTEP